MEGEATNLEQLEAQRRQNSTRQVIVKKRQKAARNRRKKGNKAERGNNPLMRVGAESLFSYSMSRSNASAPTAAGPASSMLPGLRARPAKRGQPPMPVFNGYMAPPSTAPDAEAPNFASVGKEKIKIVPLKKRPPRALPPA